MEIERATSILLIELYNTFDSYFLVFQVLSLQVFRRKAVAGHNAVLHKILFLHPKMQQFPAYFSARDKTPANHRRAQYFLFLFPLYIKRYYKFVPAVFKFWRW